ncbi:MULTISPECIES: hypothetical protein [Silvimonas]|uniref:hypothetical protein n=1 Tax=Silvimonas TaxID=300264 RepID=UPI0024B38DCA|nr:MULTISPECIES: hypothetical protein [Silvimonas]MDR3428918.1 hypothetical protein [Silvimonas sp.]
MMAMYDMESGASVMEPGQDWSDRVQTVANLQHNPLPMAALRLLTIEEAMASSKQQVSRPAWPQT